ncbi:hypothetical protein [Actibacterium pelagium]|uniref:Uncharacterized protein n=1 Tax=Actibacterium pelagium TaxID=2029103 RepID=A0A917AGP5_9RHOB|nr:hypothetical protein [Actibacterium pelagium]GGE51549.1 hypothetical protein GCM10011517_19090 [Actibacterium pelagium]
MHKALLKVLKVLVSAVAFYAAVSAAPVLAQSNAVLDRAISNEIVALAPKGAHKKYSWKKQVSSKSVRLRASGRIGKIDARFNIPRKTSSGSSPGLIPVKIEFRNADGSRITITFMKGKESRYEEIKKDGTKEIRLFNPDGSFKTVTLSKDGSYYQEVCDSGQNCVVTTGNISDGGSNGSLDSDLAGEVGGGGSGDGPGQGADNGNGGGNGQGGGGGTGGGGGKDK